MAARARLLNIILSITCVGPDNSIEYLLCGIAQVIVMQFESAYQDAAC